MHHPTGLSRERTEVEVLLTASEAFPALERAFLAARSEIRASFRIFDLRTRLRSPEGLAVGATWEDLLIATLRRGVAVRMVLTDFDPVARPALHRGTWASVRRFLAAAEIAGPAARLEVTAAMHSAVTGILPRFAFWPQIAWSLLRTARWLNGRDPIARRRALREMPGLRPSLRDLADGRLRARLFGVPPVFPATHHQKLAVFDRERLYIGGLDLDERRFDTPDHDRPGHATWHDVQLMVRGPVVAEAQAHLETFLDVVAGRADPPPQRRLLRTLSRRRQVTWPYFGPEGLLHEILSAHEAMAARAERLIYIETQFFRDTGLAHALARLGRERPRLGIILVLPAAPEDVAFEGATGLDARFGEFLQGRAVRILEAAFGPRLFVGGAAQPRKPARRRGSKGGALGRDRLEGAPLVYIHAKVSVFDDRAAIVSSANLNGRSLRWDTEAGLLIDDPAQVRGLRDRVMRHWLPPDPDPRLLDPGTAVAAWRDLALRNAHRAPEAREGFILPYDVRVAERFGRAVPGVPEAMV